MSKFDYMHDNSRASNSHLRISTAVRTSQLLPHHKTNTSAYNHHRQLGSRSHVGRDDHVHVQAVLVLGNGHIRRTWELDALIPEGRGVDRPGVRRDWLREVEAEGPHSVPYILSVE